MLRHRFDAPGFEDVVRCALPAWGPNINVQATSELLASFILHVKDASIFEATATWHRKAQGVRRACLKFFVSGWRL